MSRDDPLTRWMDRANYRPARSRASSLDRELNRSFLNELAAIEANLSRPPAERKQILANWGEYRGPLGCDERLRFERAALAVAQGGGSGAHMAEEALLDAIGWAADPESTPFWMSLLEIRRPRDKFAQRRRLVATAALAFLFVRKGCEAGIASLRDCLRNSDPAVRADAAEHLGRACLATGGALPGPVATELGETARSDAAWMPRCVARAVLRAVEKPVPIDRPDAAWRFDVRLAGSASFQCELDVRSDQTLDDLHHAIQDAFDWDCDHLHAFFLDGKGGRLNLSGSEDEEDDLLSRFVATARMGEISMPVGHRFEYLFDFGDHNVFELRVVGVVPHDAQARYPRVVAATGRRPRQYRHW